MPDYLYVELWFLVEGFTVVPLTAEMIDAVVNVVVVLVAVLRRCLFVMDSGIERRVIGATIVFVLGQVGVR